MKREEEGRAFFPIECVHGRGVVPPNEQRKSSRMDRRRSGRRKGGDKEEDCVYRDEKKTRVERADSPGTF